jgi:hypothetical protein
MPVSRLASESDIQGTDILITDAATLIRTTDTGTTGRTTVGTTVGRHFIGITDTACIIRVRIIATIATGGKTNGEKFSQAGGFNVPPAYFFGEPEAAGDDGEGS